jgi:hypothetical protein
MAVTSVKSLMALLKLSTALSDADASWPGRKVSRNLNFLSPSPMHLGALLSLRERGAGMGSERGGLL